MNRLFEVSVPFEVYRDEPWTVDGAAVRVAIVCAATDMDLIEERRLDGNVVEDIHSDLQSKKSSGDADLTKSSKILQNHNTSFQGVVPRSSLSKKEAEKAGCPPSDFAMPGERARQMLASPTNPNGRRNFDVIRPYLIGLDITRRPQDRFIVNFQDWDENDAALYEEPYSYVQPVRCHRAHMKQPEALEYWWQFWRVRDDMLAATKSLRRFIVSPRVAKYRLFRWVEGSSVIDNALVAIARDDDTTFGILHSRFHEAWSLRMGTFLGKGNDPRYTPTTCFETFPFPEGMTPDIPAEGYAGDPRAQAIAEAAKRLDELRERWLNPPEWVDRVPEVVPGYPDRLVPKDEEAAKALKKRTLTNLYNERPAWLDHAHRNLDRAVAAAYGWTDENAGENVSDDEVLARLFALNQERAAAQGD